MKVILTHEVTGLGTAGDVVDVKDGYARNFLFRRGLATAWTKGGQKQAFGVLLLCLRCSAQSRLAMVSRWEPRA